MVDVTTIRDEELSDMTEKEFNVKAVKAANRLKELIADLTGTKEKAPAEILTLPKGDK